jgi:hypothetical protein
MAPRRVLDTVRQHWGVENNLHWPPLDVVFHEDDARSRKTMHGKTCLSSAGWRWIFLTPILAQGVQGRDSVVNGAILAPECLADHSSHSLRVLRQDQRLFIGHRVPLRFGAG